MKRYGQVIRLQQGVLEKYKKYHASIWPEVAAQISASHIHNYSIYHKDGFLFAYFEYTGTNFVEDMARMGEDPKTREWWAIMEPMQDPLLSRNDGEWWANMEECFHQE